MKNKKEIIEKIFSVLYILSIIIAGFILFIRFTGEEPDSVGLISLCYLCFCAYAYHKCKIDERQNIHEKVAWIAEKESYYNNYSRLRDSELTKYIEIEQRILNVPQQFSIDFSNETEKEYLNQILNKHKKHVIELYFCNRLKVTKDICCLNSLGYYFFSLYCFVFDNYYKDNEAYEKKEYISDWQFKCQLTEYGRVYYKLYLIMWLYVENNEQIRNLFEYINKEEKNYILEILEKNETRFFI